MQGSYLRGATRMGSGIYVVAIGDNVYPTPHLDDSERSNSLHSSGERLPLSGAFDSFDRFWWFIKMGYFQKLLKMMSPPLDFYPRATRNFAQRMHELDSLYPALARWY